MAVYQVDVRGGGSIRHKASQTCYRHACCPRGAHCNLSRFTREKAWALELFRDTARGTTALPPISFWYCTSTNATHPYARAAATPASIYRASLTPAISSLPLPSTPRCCPTTPSHAHYTTTHLRTCAPTRTNTFTLPALHSTAFGLSRRVGGHNRRGHTARTGLHAPTHRKTRMLVLGLGRGWAAGRAIGARVGSDRAGPLKAVPRLTIRSEPRALNIWIAVSGETFAGAHARGAAHRGIGGRIRIFSQRYAVSGLLAFYRSRDALSNTGWGITVCWFGLRFFAITFRSTISYDDRTCCLVATST